MDRPIHFYISSTTAEWSMREIDFIRIEMNKPLYVPVHKVSQVRFNLNNCSCCRKSEDRIHRIKSSITRLDSSITDNIIRRVINVMQEN